MKQEIRHRRLHAFYQSKVLNSLMILVIVCLLSMAYTKFMLLPVICGALALLLFISYSLWFWIKKPQNIIINNRLSNINGYLTLYYLIIVAIKDANQWWYITPIALTVLLFFIVLVNNKDEQFDI